MLFYFIIYKAFVLLAAVIFKPFIAVIAAKYCFNIRFLSAKAIKPIRNLIMFLFNKNIDGICF
jgi:hypothetical protein